MAPTWAVPGLLFPFIVTWTLILSRNLELNWRRPVFLTTSFCHNFYNFENFYHFFPIHMPLGLKVNAIFQSWSRVWEQGIRGMESRKKTKTFNDCKSRGKTKGNPLGLLTLSDFLKNFFNRCAS